jgi:HEAT repeat protein
VTDFVLARRLQQLGRRPSTAQWDAVLDALHAAVPLSRAAAMVLCDLRCDADTRRVDLVTLLARAGGDRAEDRLVGYLADPAPQVVRAAVRALGAVGTHRCAPALAAVGGHHASAARRALVRVQARVGALQGAVSEGVDPGDGRVSVPRSAARGRLATVVREAE